MKRKYLLLLFVLVSTINCETYKSIFSIVSNKFSAVEEPNNSNFQTWNKLNLFILRVELKHTSKIKYNKNNDTIIELTDYPLKDYKLLTLPGCDKENIVEEVYLYLSNFKENVNSGLALYMSSMPLKPHVSKLMFCNRKFISTYGLNHVMDGSWLKEGNNIKLKLEDKENQLILEGTISEKSDRKMIEFTQVNHPKSKVEDDINLIQIRDVFEVNPNGKSDSNNIPRGIRFFQNKNRIFVHPNWSIIGENFDYEFTARYYFENLEKRKITKVMIGRNNDVYFKINDPSLQTPNNNVIKYQR